jgi:hypothetical protein
MAFKIFVIVLFVTAFFVVYINRKRAHVYREVTYALLGAIIYYALNVFLNLAFGERAFSSGYQTFEFIGLICFIFLGLFVVNAIKRRKAKE